MTQETIGYVELEWTCPTCGNRNPGASKKCATCGAAQPEDVQFEQAAQDTLLTDQAKIEQAKAGPDIHCPYCGTRNPAGAKQCKQCAGDLTGGKARQTGRIVGALHTETAPPVACPACGAQNPATAQRCAKCGAALAKLPAKPAPAQPAAPSPISGRLVLVIVGVAVVACLALIFLLTRTEQQVGEVSTVNWQRIIAVQALAPVTREDWQDDIPAGAEVGSCSRQMRYTSPDPQPDSVKVCGTPYVVDTGTGVGKAVQNCQYQVYEPRCRYTTLEWVVAPALVAEGSDFSPRWPAAGLSQDQREAGRQEVYEIIFNTDGQDYRYQVDSLEEFSQFTPGSRWQLEVGTLGNVVSVEPAR